ncbi:MAG: amidase [Acidobacteriota bacterium]|nr:amidase [Acidobacteriota bacterium]
MNDDEPQGRELNRRELLGTVGAAGALALGGSALAQPAGSAAPISPASQSAAAAPKPFELEELSVRDLSAGMAAGRWTSRRLVELYLGRIAEVDRAGVAGVGTNAIAETNPQVMEIADGLDRERAAGKLRGPLHGIPIVLKDNIDTGDRMKTTAGSLALGESVAAKDAYLVERLRAAGAVILGKTNLSEWANFRSTRSTSGWSGRGGQVRNPYVLDRNPCGSSSGTGSGISGNLAAAGIGTETDGSILCPASMCGLVGIKPTVGLVSRRGIIPISSTQDTAGPMCRTVADAAIVLSAITGTDLLDPATAASAGKAADYTRSLDANGLAGARLGVVRKFFGWHPEVDRQMQAVLELLRQLGAVLVDPVEIPHVKDYDNGEYEIMLYEFKHGLNAYLAGLREIPGGGTPRSLAELIAWNRQHAQAEMPWFGQEIFEQAEAKGPLTEEAYGKALESNLRLSRGEGIDAVLAGQRLDGLICPTMGPAYLTDWLNGDHFGGSATSPCAVAGYPHVTVPAGQVQGLPWGLSFMGTAWSEARLIRFAHAFEQASQARRPPRFLATVGYTA